MKHFYVKLGVQVFEYRADKQTYTQTNVGKNPTPVRVHYLDH